MAALEHGEAALATSYFGSLIFYAQAADC